MCMFIILETSPLQLELNLLFAIERAIARVQLRTITQAHARALRVAAVLLVNAPEEVIDDGV